MSKDDFDFLLRGMLRTGFFGLDGGIGVRFPFDAKMFLFTVAIELASGFLSPRVKWSGERGRVMLTTHLLPVTVKKVRLSLCLTNLALRHEGVWGNGRIDPHFS
jgi:hypothetical protein